MKKIAAFLVLISSIAITAQSQVTVKQLLCENLVEPIGLDVSTPRFSWQLQSSKRNVLQSAYEIKIVMGKTAVWNSGKISS